MSKHTSTFKVSFDGLIILGKAVFFRLDALKKILESGKASKVETMEVIILAEIAVQLEEAAKLHPELKEIVKELVEIKTPDTSNLN